MPRKREKKRVVVGQWWKNIVNGVGIRRKERFGTLPDIYSQKICRWSASAEIVSIYFAVGSAKKAANPYVALGLLIKRFMAHTERRVDQIRRRVIKGQKIPQYEKVLSFFEEPTEWISKSKTGVP
jgi:hypothetical protein